MYLSIWFYRFFLIPSRHLFVYSFLASRAFACQKSQSFLPKMPLAQRKMCLEWSPGDQDGRFLRMAKLHVHGPSMGSSVPPPITFQGAAQISILDQLEAFVTITPKFDKKVVNLGYIKHWSPTKTSTWHWSLQQRHSFIRRVHLMDFPKAIPWFKRLRQMKQLSFLRHTTTAVGRLKSKEPGADYSKGGPPCSQRSDRWCSLKDVEACGRAGKNSPTKLNS